MASELRDNDSTGNESLLGIICPYSRIFSLVFAVSFVFTLISVASIIKLSPPSESYYAALMTAFFNGSMMIVMLALLLACGRYFRR